jgi:hypothetical protein
MASVLEGLDRVDWSRLTHAYGSAADVPHQVRALRSPDADQRRKAFEQLYSNIFHQGSRYEATAYAVPFLLEVLADPDAADRVALLELLTAIAIGDDDRLPDGFPIAEYRRAATGGDALLAAGPHPGDDYYDQDVGDFHYLESLSDEQQRKLSAHVEVAAYDAVKAGVPMFRTLLADPDPAMRTMAAYELAWFPEDAPGSLPPLAATAVEGSCDPDNDAVAATALVAIGLLDGQPSIAFLYDPRPVVRWGAAIALTRVQGTDAGQAVVEELFAWAGGTATRDHRIPFLDGDLAAYACLALTQVGPQYADATFDALLNRIPSVSGADALPAVILALSLAFPAGRLPEGTPFTALNDRQRRLVRALPQSPDSWRTNGRVLATFRALARAYGLPDDSDVLRTCAQMTT